MPHRITNGIAQRQRARPGLRIGWVGGGAGTLATSEAGQVLMRRGRYDSRMGTWDSVDDRRYRRAAYARPRRRNATGAIAGGLAVLAVVGVILALWVLGGSHGIPVDQTTSRSHGQVATAQRPLVAA